RGRVRGADRGPSARGGDERTGLPRRHARGAAQAREALVPERVVRDRSSALRALRAERAAMPIVSPKSAPVAEEERAAIRALMRNASVEMTAHDAPQLDACRTLLPPGTPVYVSFLPKQTWARTVETAAAVRAAGFEPIPHLPAREIESRAQLTQILDDLRRTARVRRVLLIAGDRDTPRGPYASSAEVVETSLLQVYGIEAVAFAGHPEGSPRIAPEVLRAAERDKIEAARR